jgi:hypothetical protein
MFRKALGTDLNKSRYHKVFKEIQKLG